ncbi:unnamed protein product [Zymoseptoria tritici ST99CH_1A5]|uniref:Uncharacterized protein n=1 Tax=Zymoseptoria tritici ST99CH_1A5 TaxID=1276529 RepID=A0A1Y6LIL1_ZYMTR|nr:unnamed protein product [Zymoseptoria tritici ST99CH_1A5]
MGNFIPCEADFTKTTRTNQEVSAKLLELRLAYEDDEAQLVARSIAELVRDGYTAPQLCHLIATTILEVEVAEDAEKVKELVRWLLEITDVLSPKRRFMLRPGTVLVRWNGIAVGNESAEPIDIMKVWQALDEMEGITAAAG